MIGNTDFSIYAQHNVVLVQRPDKSIHPVPYDFDISGLVRPPYAAPDPALMLASFATASTAGRAGAGEKVALNQIPAHKRP